MLKRSGLKRYKPKVSLGPPLRAVDLNYQSSGEEDETDGKGRETAKAAGPTHPRTPNLQNTNNKENDWTPCAPACLSASVGTAKRLPPTAKDTPSSTYPSFLSSIPKSSTKKEAQTPSSTFPESRPPLPSGSAYQHRPLHVPPMAIAVVAPLRELQRNTEDNMQGNPVPLPPQHHSTSKPACSTSKAVPPTDSVPRPFLDHSATKRSQTQACSPERLFTLTRSPEEKMNVVVMKSANEEKRFVKLTLLGCGGSSKVYKVISEDYQIFALKEVYLRHVDPAIKKAYINEIKLLLKLKDNPDIISLHDYWWDGEEKILYLLLEYAEMDLNAVIQDRTRTHHPLTTAAYFWTEMLRVVKMIHDEGVIHNDLKPENFVCIGGRLKLIDFGIANKIEAEKTSIERDIRCGTINYMAPETIETYEDKDVYKVGRPSDVWSLGCILYLMIYGKTPFAHIRNKLFKWHAITDPSIPISFPNIGNQAALDVMQRCLRRNPKERPTIDELLCHPFSCFQTSIL